METGTEAGIAPEEVARIVTPEAVQYANGDEVITADGVQGRITGKQGGSYVVQLDTGQFVLTPAHALTPKSEAPPPTETTTAIAPAQHNEATDTDTTNNEPIARQLAEAIRAAAGEPGCTTNHTTYARRSGRCRTTANVFGRLAVFTAARHGNGSR